MIKKLSSKKGYVVTYEAILISILFISAFYVVHMVYTHNYLTSVEEVRDIEKFEKCNLKADVLFKKGELPSEGYEDNYSMFLRRVSEKFWGSNKMAETFNPYANLTKVVSSEFYFENKSPINLESNVNISPPNLSNVELNNDFIKTRNLLVPIKTWKYVNKTNISESLIEGDSLYFMINASENENPIPTINISANTTTNALFLVNSVPFNLSINETSKNANLTMFIEHYEPNEIKLIDTSPNAKVNFTIIYNHNYTFYVLILRQSEISCHVKMN